MKRFSLLGVFAIALCTGSVDAQTFTYTTINDPLATNDTVPSGIDGNNIVGYYNDAASSAHGFLYNMSTNSYTTLDDPLATNGAYNGYNGTYAWGIDGNNIVGQYTTGTSYHGFLYNINTNSYTTLDDPCRVSEYLPRVLSV